MIKLIYIFIHDYGNIKDQGFNLSSDFIVHFDQKAAKLTVTKRTEKIPHLFHEDIVDFKGIVGENGAGKSTLLNYLSTKAHEPDIDLGDNKASKDIIVYLSDFDGANYIYVNAGAAWALHRDQVLNETDIKLAPGQLGHNLEHIYWHDMREFSATRFIYYSNVFDNKPGVAYNQLLNISTNYLSREDVQTRTNNLVKASDIESHRMMEGKRQFEFALAYDDKLPFPLSKDCFIYDIGHAQILIRQKIGELEAEKRNAPKKSKSIPVVSDETIAKEPFNSRFPNWLKRWQNLCEKYNWLSTSKPQQKMVHQAFFSQLIFNYIIERKEFADEQFRGYINYTEAVLVKILTFFEEGKGIVNIQHLIEFCEDLEPGIYAEIHLNDQPISVGIGSGAISNPLKEFLRFEKKLAPFYKQKPRFYNNGFLMTLDDKSVEIYRHYIKSTYLTHYLDFMLPGLSSGELGYLTLFARFFALVSGAKSLRQEVETGENNLIILIDEGDLYFHPRWQTEYINYLNEVLPLIFPKKMIQIILTSHSQFLASDLPTRNLLFMQREHLPKKARKIMLNNGLARVVPGPEMTFAANVHDLLSDTFFLDGAHIGQFAKEILYKLMDKLEGKNDQKVNWTVEEMDNLIREVGEPWLQSRLKEKFEKYLRENQS